MLVVVHDKDVISIADYVIDVGPQAGQNGGEMCIRDRGRRVHLLMRKVLPGQAGT